MPTARTAQPNQTAEMSKRSKRSIGEDVFPAPGHSWSHVPEDFRSINGWGADLDPANRPMSQKEFPSAVRTARGTVTAWQEPTHRIHMSNEQPNLTPVFGTSCPPRGLSGMLRDYAYQFGEGTNRHWMTLILADRIDIMESMVIDALRGRPDNIIAEKAWPTRIKYKKGGGERSAASLVMVGAAALSVVALGAMFTMRDDD